MANPDIREVVIDSRMVLAPLLAGDGSKIEAIRIYDDVTPPGE
jgi:hypothetical protein